MTSGSTVQVYKQAMDMIPASLLTSFKAVVTFLILFNIQVRRSTDHYGHHELITLSRPQSFPLAWHYNVMAKYFAWLAKSRFLGKIEEPAAKTHPDPRGAVTVRHFRAWPTHCDCFGWHFSNSSYGAFADTVRGPHIYSILGLFFDLPTSTFALGCKWTSHRDLNSSYRLSPSLRPYYMGACVWPRVDR